MIYFNTPPKPTLHALLVQEGDVLRLSLVTSGGKHILLEIFEEDDPDSVHVINTAGDLLVNTQNSVIATFYRKPVYVNYDPLMDDLTPSGEN